MFEFRAQLRLSLSIQMISEAASARLRYSASVDDLATVGCFLDCHDTRVIHAPWLLRSDVSPAQSESGYASSIFEDIGRRWIPTNGFPDMYLNILCKACHWIAVGLLKNCEILFTELCLDVLWLDIGEIQLLTKPYCFFLVQFKILRLH